MSVQEQIDANRETKVYIVPRPYHVTFPESGNTYPMTSVEVERLIAAYPLVEARINRIVLRADDGQLCPITPATLGGGPAFTIERGSV